MRRRQLVVPARDRQQVTVAIHEFNSRAKYLGMGEPLEQMPLEKALGVRRSCVIDIAAYLADWPHSGQSKSERLDQIATQGLRNIAIKPEDPFRAISFVAAEQFIPAVPGQHHFDAVIP